MTYKKMWNVLTLTCQVSQNSRLTLAHFSFNKTFSRSLSFITLFFVQSVSYCSIFYSPFSYIVPFIVRKHYFKTLRNRYCSFKNCYIICYLFPMTEFICFLNSVIKWYNKVNKYFIYIYLKKIIMKTTETKLGKLVLLTDFQQKSL